MNYYFHPAAEAEYLESIAYYESKRAGLGALYIAAFEKTVSSVCVSPHRYPTANNADIRCAQIKTFPFSVLYRESSNNIQILAVAHHRRRPQFWLGRH